MFQSVVATVKIWLADIKLLMRMTYSLSKKPPKGGFFVIQQSASGIDAGWHAGALLKQTFEYEGVGLCVGHKTGDVGRQ